MEIQSFFYEVRVKACARSGTRPDKKKADASGARPQV